MTDPIDPVFARRRLIALAVAGIIAVAFAVAISALLGRGGNGVDNDAAAPDATTPAVTRPPYSFAPRAATDAVGVMETADGIVVPIVRVEGDQTIGLSPCGVDAVVVGGRIATAHVVLDPGHGGTETGAIGPNGVMEKDANLGVALAAKEQLEAMGATVVLTRSTDMRLTVATRAAIVNAVDPLLFVSIHHNTVAKSSGPGIGSELYHQGTSPASKRLAGLLWESYVETIEPELSEWAHGGEPGARARLSRDGTDFYGVLRLAAGVPSVLSEAAYLSDENEAALLATERFYEIEARAITDAIVAFVSSDAAGSGFVPDTVSDEAAGGGGTDEGCEDPALRAATHDARTSSLRSTEPARVTNARVERK